MSFVLESAVMGAPEGATMFDETHRKLRRLILSQDDVRQASEIARYILEHDLWDETKWSDSRIIGRGLQNAMVVSYIRPFSGNSDTRHTLTRPNIGIDKLLTESEWQSHQEIKRMRDTVFAHTDAELRDLSLVIHQVGENATAKAISHNPYVMKSKQAIESFLSLFDRVLCLLSEKTIKLQRELEVGSKHPAP